VQGQGLIELAGTHEEPEASVDSGSEAMVRSDSSSSASTSYDPDHAELPGAKDCRAVPQIKLICIDMDGKVLRRLMAPACLITLCQQSTSVMSLKLVLPRL